MPFEPEVIGSLYGVSVLIDRESRSVIISCPEYMPSIKISIDDPNIQGTKLERSARSALDNVSQ
jgi:hypothetical protein